MPGKSHGRRSPTLPQPAPSRARTLEAGKRWARLAQARAASRPGLCATAPGRRAGDPPLWQLVPGIPQARTLEWLPCSPPGDLPDPGIEPRYPTLQVDSLPSEPPGKPKNTGVGSLTHFLGRGTDTPGYRQEKPAGTTHSSRSDLSPREQLESSCGARAVRSPCAWRGGARPGSRVTGGD